MYRLCIKEHFSAAHYLAGYDGDCANLHGHRWEVEVFLTFPSVDSVGMAIDFRELKTLLKGLLPDHQCLNAVYDFNPTAENIAKHLFEELLITFLDNIEKVRVWESPECYAEYYETTNKA